MSEQFVSNDVSGQVKGSVLQARTIRDVRVSSTVNNLVKEARSLKLVATAYRVVASLAALAAIAADHGDTPLDALAAGCDALALPSGWAVSTASWIAERAELVGGVAQLLLMVGLMALPRPRQMGWDVGQTMEWRSPSTVVLSFVLLVQCGDTWPALLTVAVAAAVGTWMLSGPKHRWSRSDHMMVIVVGIILAVFFAPLLVLMWFFGRDASSASYAPAEPD
ncbi:hypothetical protein [Streptomyces sp. S1]|uniref:hypothetical protein n=1 Tax=unclassified Streptomyces TaxID=2593676 RepID=UPI000EF786B5|nr:hypothetical protein [Streptomyces sp. S1]